MHTHLVRFSTTEMHFQPARAVPERVGTATRRGVAAVELVAYIPLVLLSFALIWQILSISFQSMASHVSAYQGALDSSATTPEGTSVESQTLGGKPGIIARSSREYRWKHPWVAKTPVSLEFDGVVAVSAPAQPEKPEDFRHPLQVPTWSGVYLGKRGGRVLSDVARLGHP